MLPMRLAALGTAFPLSTYIDDFFVPTSHVGTGASQSVTSGLDLLDTDGMVWIKDRSATNSHVVVDTKRGLQKDLYPNASTAEVSESSVIAFAKTGFTVGTIAAVSALNDPFISYSFKIRPDFFDVQTYTGDGSAGRTLLHNLHSVPGMVWVKSRSGVGDWAIYHTSATGDVYLNTTAAQTGSRVDITAVSSTTVTLGSGANVNSNGVTYVAYFFAHDASAAGFSQCGTYTGNGSTTGPVVNLGWEPQLLMIRNVSSAGTNWVLMDNQRGLFVASADLVLTPNTNVGDASNTYVVPTATGFNVVGTTSDINLNGSKYVYYAIRRSNKPPTAGTQVYNAIARTGNGAATTVAGIGFNDDLSIVKERSSTQAWAWTDRLRGPTFEVASSSTAAEAAFANDVTDFSVQNSLKVGSGASGQVNTNAATYINYFFKRAAQFFDEVCYTGSGSNTTVAHELGVTPELMIVKDRTNVRAWSVFHKIFGGTEALALNTTAIPVVDATVWNSTAPTAASFSVGTSSTTNTMNDKYVAHLFASIAGVSSIGGYVGNGSSGNVVNCGFTTGARFVMIKRLDAVGDWFVWDTARGIPASGNSAHVSLNTTAAEVASDASVNSNASGFAVSQVAATNINVGSTWTAATGFVGNWSLVAYMTGHMYVALQSGSTAYMTSSNGSAWTSRTLPVSANWSALIVANATYVALGSGSNIAITSVNASTWTQQTLPSSQSWSSLTFSTSSSLFVAIAKSTSTYATSPDGVTWTSRTMPSSQNWSSVTFGNGLLVAIVSGSNVCATSTDSINWTSRTLPSSQTWTSVAYGNGIFVAVTNNGSGAVYATSPDGINWTQRTLPIAYNANNITFVNGLFIIPPVTGSTVLVGLDGIVWTQQTMTISGNWQGVAFSTSNSNYTMVNSGNTSTVNTNAGIGQYAYMAIA